LGTRDYAIIRQASANRLFDLVDLLVRSESRSFSKVKPLHSKKRLNVISRMKFNSSFHRGLRTKPGKVR
jgi:hypothetical protein